MEAKRVNIPGDLLSPCGTHGLRCIKYVHLQLEGPQTIAKLVELTRLTAVCFMDIYIYIHTYIYIYIHTYTYIYIYIYMYIYIEIERIG